MRLGLSNRFAITLLAVVVRLRSRTFVRLFAAIA